MVTIKANNYLVGLGQSVIRLSEMTQEWPCLISTLDVPETLYLGNVFL